MNNRQWPPVFISLRYVEAEREGKQLQAALQEQGVQAYINDSDLGGDLCKEIPYALQGAVVYVIMASKTYGRDTGSPVCTYKELQYILQNVKDGKREMVPIKMTDTFEEPFVQMNLHDGLKYCLWKQDMPMPINIVHDIVDKVVRLTTQAAGVLPNHEQDPMWATRLTFPGPQQESNDNTATVVLGAVAQNVQALTTLSDAGNVFTSDAGCNASRSQAAGEFSDQQHHSPAEVLAPKLPSEDRDQPTMWADRVTANPKNSNDECPGPAEANTPTPTALTSSSLVEPTKVTQASDVLVVRNLPPQASAVIQIPVEDPQQLYSDGRKLYIAKKYAQAVPLLRRAADLGLPAAQSCLGHCYLRGQGVSADYAYAVQWYRKAADQGDARGFAGLGSCYQDGKGVAVDQVEAERCFRRSYEILRSEAEQGNAEAQFKLGVNYKYGKGISQDLVKAVQWFRSSADQGNAAAQLELGVCYANGEGVPKDATHAAQWYRRSADQGNAQAQYELGLCSNKGEGVAKDKQLAQQLFEKASNQNHRDALWARGLICREGKNFDQARVYFRKAEQLGYEKVNAPGLCAFGDTLYDEFNIHNNNAEAAKWYLAAAELGHHDATAYWNLFKIYSNGWGFERDISRATKFLRLAKELGHEEARSWQANVVLCMPTCCLNLL